MSYLVNEDFQHNKYFRWYTSLIKRGENRILKGYTETHHIIPRCMGGKDSRDNLVELTAKEHFLAHWLLTKFVVGKASTRLHYAFGSMRRNAKNMKRVYNGNEYEAMRRSTARACSLLHKGKKLSKEHRRKISEGQMGRVSARKGVVLTAETKQKMRLAKLGKRQSKAHIKKRIEARLKTLRLQSFRRPASSENHPR